MTNQEAIVGLKWGIKMKEDERKQQSQFCLELMKKLNLMINNDEERKNTVVQAYVKRLRRELLELSKRI